MYFTEFKIENTGPLGDFILTPEFNQDGSPKPIVIAGENGSGKSILLAHLINFLMMAKQQQYTDSEIEQGKVYKYRTPNYIQTGKHHSYSKIKMNELELTECQLPLKKSGFQEKFGYEPDIECWERIPANESSLFEENFQNHTAPVEKLIDENCTLYFPVNRFEEPAWLNVGNLKESATFTDLKRLSGYSNRKIINISPLKSINNWLLDLLLDRELYEKQTALVPILNNGQPINLNVFNGYNGVATNTINSINKILKIILRKQDSDNVRFGADRRQNRRIALQENDQLIVPNIFQMSTGETQLINLFISIIKDFDLSKAELTSLDEITGVVIVDEIDAHLHSIHQFEVLPKLIKAFPKVQFIITSHSPLFAAGLKDTLGEDGFTLVDMPTGRKINTDDFSEFEQALNALKQSRHFINEVETAIKATNNPVIYAEGNYDVRYITKACQLFNRNRIIDNIDLKDADGEKNLSKIWNQRNLKVFDEIPNATVLLYDGEIDIQPAEHRNLMKRKINFIEENPIKVGIENLFSMETINNLREHNQRFINHTPVFQKTVNGVLIEVDEVFTLNKDQKRNICDYLCDNGTEVDFQSFLPLLDMLEELLLPEQESESD